MIPKWLKNFFKSDNARFEEITPEFLEEQMKARDEASYAKWLRNCYGSLIALCVARKTKVGKIPDFWTGRIKLIEQEIAAMQQKGFLPKWKPLDDL